MSTLFVTMPGCSTVSQHVTSWIPNRERDRDVQFNLARIREKEGQHIRAKEEFLKLHERFPQDAQICHRLGILSARTGNIPEAVRYFELATSYEPTNAEIWSDYGFMYLQEQKYAEAENALQKALELSPKNERALSNLALAYGYQGRMDESFATFRRVGSEAKAHSNLAYLYVQLGKPELATRHYSRALSLDGSLRPAGQALLQLAEMKRQTAPNSPDEAVNRPDVLLAKNEKPQKGLNSDAIKENDTPEIDNAIASVESSVPASRSDEEPALHQAEADVQEPEEKQAKVTPVATAQEVDTESTALRPEANEPDENIDLFASDDPKPAPLDDEAPAPASKLQSSELVRLCPNARGEVLQLVMTLETEDAVQLKRALHQLGQMGMAAEGAIPALQKTLHHADVYVQIHSALALWRIAQTTDDVVPVLVQALGQDDAAVCSFAAAALGEIGSHSSEVLPALNAALSGQDGYSRLHVAEALARSEQWKPHAAHVLAECLQDDDENVRWLATYSLADLAPADPDVVHALTTALSDDQPRIQAGAAWALGEIGPAARSASDQLEKVSQQTEDKDVQEAAAQALQAIDENR
ncbi:MAG: HEAT repeat domain-containing protein [Planctomycetaceae bacterium]